MKVFNLTKHQMTQDQLEAGGVNVPAAQSANNLQDFMAVPSHEELESRANALMNLASAAGAELGDGVMIAGAMYFIPALVQAARNSWFTPTFSFTQRKAVEDKLPDGSVKLSYVFKHESWVHI